MSYWDLWDNYSKVKDNWDDSKNLIYYLTELISHKIEVEREYANGLQRLTRAAVFNRGKNTITPCLKRLISIFNEQSQNIFTLIEQQHSDLIPSLKNLLALQDEAIKSKARYAKDFETELQKHTATVEKAKTKYFSYCESSEIPTKREESAAKKYIKAVEGGNKFLDIFESSMKGILELLQTQEEEKLKCLKDTLRKLNVYEVSYMRSVQYELELMPMAIDSFNPEIEIKKFIDEESSGNPFKKFVFEPHPRRYHLEVPFQAKSFTQLSQETVESLYDKCWKGIQINDEDYKNFTDIISQNESRRAFLQKMNEKRLKDEMAIPSCTFGIFCGLVSALLDKVEEFQDINSAKQLLFLSQCFFEETLSQKTFMHHIILTHKIWADYKIWSQLIITSVDIEMESDAKICREDSASISQAIKLRPVLNNKISSYLQQMKIFSIDNSVIEKALKLVQEYYRFTIDIGLIVKE